MISDFALVATAVLGKIVLPMIMEDELLHTIENGFFCGCTEYLRVSLFTYVFYQQGQAVVLTLANLLILTTVALRRRNTSLKPVWEQNWFARSARRGVGLKRGGHVFQTSDGHMRGLGQTVGIALPVDASISHPTGSPLVA